MVRPCGPTVRSASGVQQKLLGGTTRTRVLGHRGLQAHGFLYESDSMKIYGGFERERTNNGIGVRELGELAVFDFVVRVVVSA
jgi:hypothetical protein